MNNRSAVTESLIKFEFSTIQNIYITHFID